MEAEQPMTPTGSPSTAAAPPPPDTAEPRGPPAAERPLPRRNELAIAAVLLLGAVLAAHGGIRDAQLVSFDDAVYVTANPHVQQGLTSESVAWAFALDGRKTYYHPLTWLSLMLDRQLFGPGPLGFHATNVALHAAAALLLLLALAKATGRLGPSLAAALLFAVHPLNVEAVMWVAERKIVLSAALGMGALLAYVHHARAPSWRRMLVVAALFGSSLLAKPGLVILPALLLLLDVWPLGRLPLFAAPDEGRVPLARRLGALLLEKTPLVLLAAASLAVSILSVQATVITGEHASLGLRLATAVAVVPTYLGKALWPTGLAVFHPYPVSVGAGAVAWGAAVIVGLGAAAFLAARRYPWLFVGWAWFLVALAPYLGLLQAGLWPEWAERYAYAALVGPAVAIAFHFAHVAERRGLQRLPLVAAGLAVVPLTLAAHVQGRHWRDSEALFRRAVAVEPLSAVLRYNLGNALLTAGRRDEARPPLEAALRLAGEYPEAESDLGAIDRQQGRLAEAEVHLRRAVRARPDYPQALFNLGSLLRQTGRVPESREYLVRFLKVTEDGRYGAQRAAVQAILARP